MINDKEKEILNNLRAPSSAVMADAKRYVNETRYRALIDDADSKLGTKLGPKLRALALGLEQEPVQKPPVATQPTEIETAAAIKKYPNMESVKDMRDSKVDALNKLSKEEYRQYKIAAILYKVLPPSAWDSASSVRFNYVTPAQHRANLATKEEEAARAASVSSIGADALPPGITRNEKGELYQTDAVAFNAWKTEQAALKEARATIAAALEEQS